MAEVIGSLSPTEFQDPGFELVQLQLSQAFGDINQKMGDSSLSLSLLSNEYVFK